MVDRTMIKPFEEQDIKIYAYSLPSVPDHKGCIKVGETVRDVEKRIREQLATAGLTPNIHFTKKAQKSNGEWFHDKDLHKYFILNKVEKKDFGTGADEWFYFNGNPELAEELTDKFIALDYDGIQIDKNRFEYKLRKEQSEAVEKTLEYYKQTDNRREFLWNAKPRFGKTLTAYDFIRKIKGLQFLIVTNRPAIANSWFDDFEKFISWQEPNLKFVSDSSALQGKAITRKAYIEMLLNKDYSSIYFISLQDLKGAKVFGGQYEKYRWISELNWDLVIIDEAHEGVDTYKTDKAFSKIKRKFTLHLSGTPFKAIASQKFSESQIYNWSYLDEQAAKNNWNELVGSNPYQSLPVLNLFTYQMSKLIEDKALQGTVIDENINVDYAFDLNEFFKVDKDRFIYEADVERFLDNLSSNKFPFSLDTHRNELKHTFWLLNRVDSVKALEKLLKKHPVFKNYELVIAAGDGISSDEEDDTVQEKSLDKVKRAIRENERTITLSVGQLTTGITIPEWTGVLMLSNIKSPSLYFQAAFRCQNPYEYKDEATGMLLRKENAYVFDFAPERTLNLYDEYANNLKASSSSATSSSRKENIRELLNFLPVIAEDEYGELKEIDAEDVLSIPLKIKSEEVVKRGFMSNLLFANISSIFSAPVELREILDKLSPEKQGKTKKTNIGIDYTKPSLNENNEVEIKSEIVINKSKEIFGDKVYKNLNDKDFKIISNVENLTIEEREKELKSIVNNVSNKLQNGFENIKTEFNLNEKQKKSLVSAFEKDLSKKIEQSMEYKILTIKDVNSEYSFKKQNLNDEEKNELKKEYEKKVEEIEEEFKNKLVLTIEETAKSLVEEQLEKVEETKKKTTEDKVRDRLRGFSRTIPAFLMAYGNKDTTLENYEKNIDPDTFLELTSITIEEFIKLRDGFTYTTEEGFEKVVEGLFDESVFNASVKEFFDKKESLANYFENDADEDIFDYIPAQKTNQIFTPKKVVNMMLDSLEENYPNIFKDKNKKFIDLYVKSGLYLSEIAKRLFKGLENEIPFIEERIKWIFEKQLFAFAPSNIIYNIAKNFIYGEIDYLRKINLIEFDLIPVVENKKLKEKIKEVWGENMKFDVVIGNPPYQENIGSEGGNKALAKQLFPSFIYEACGIGADVVSFIIPSRWFAGDAQDKSFLKLREFIKANNHIKELHFFPDEKDVFLDVEIKGGVCYFIWQNGYKGDVNFSTHKNGDISVVNRPLFYPACETIIKDPIEAAVLKKILDKDFVSLVNITKGRNAFGIIGKEEFVESVSTKAFFEGSIELRCKSNEIRYIAKEKITKNIELSMHRYKVFISKSAGAPGKDLKVIGTPYIGKPMSACTDSLIPIGDFATLEEAENLKKYLSSKFLRFIVGILKVSQNVSQNVYQNVPLLDFSINSDIDWSKNISEIDEQLFDKYDLTLEQREHIKNSIKEM